MANNSTPQPLSTQEEQTLNDLLARKSAAQYASDETERKAKADKFKPALDVVTALNVDEVTSKIDAAIAAVGDPDVVSRLSRLRQVVVTEASELKRIGEQLNTPLPPPGSGPLPT